MATRAAAEFPRIQKWAERVCIDKEQGQHGKAATDGAAQSDLRAKLQGSASRGRPKLGEEKEVTDSLEVPTGVQSRRLSGMSQKFLPLAYLI